MKYGSICSGIEAATVAWRSLGWQAVFFAEIDPFPCAVLKHHYPEIPNLGDITKYKEWGDYGPIDLIVGGTPCQSFSVAGLRRGLADPRGNLMLVYLGILDKYRPRWMVWENVPGVLSSGGGRDFGTFLGALGELGYGWAYRILDAQYFGLAQRRRRVFVVGYLGDWRPAAAVLFERNCLSGNPPPSRKEGAGVARSITASTGGCCAKEQQHTFISRDNKPLNALEVTHPLRASWDVSEDGTGRGTPQVHVPILEAGERTGKSTTDRRAGSGIGEEGDPMFTLQAGKQHAIAAFKPGQSSTARGIGYSEHVAPTLGADGGNRTPAIAIQDISGRDKAQNGRGWNDDDTAYTVDATTNQGIMSGSAVRRLTPRECERLQGFPDDYTLIPRWQKIKNVSPQKLDHDYLKYLARGGKLSLEECIRAATDGPRYRALGNSMAVPCMHWIGRRIDKVDKLLREGQLP